MKDPVLILFIGFMLGVFIVSFDRPGAAQTDTQLSAYLEQQTVNPPLRTHSLEIVASVKNQWGW